jgi:PKD repeat protein
MISIITGRRVSKAPFVWLTLAGAGLMAASGCNKVPLLAPSQSTISLSTSSSIVQANGTAEIRATVLEGSGTPVQNGTTVTFTTNLGTVSPAETKTVNGVAVVRFLANGQSGIAEIHANSGAAKSADSTATTATAPSIKLTVGGAAASRVGLTANPSTVPSTGGTSTIVANVVDASGNPLGSVVVTFSTDAGSLSSAVATTDQNGNAQATLTTSKTATVTATAGGSTGTGTTASTPPTGTVKVTANTGPTVATFSPSPSAPSVGQLVAFSLSATVGSSPVQRIVVDFGDGDSATITGSSGGATHTYTRAGSYVVRATAFDSFGDSGTNTAVVPVTAPTKPTVAISATALGTAGAPTTFTFSANTTQAGASMDDVSINFGDGTTARLGATSGTGLTAQHVYVSAGTYTATITATDSNGATASASTVIIVGGRAPIGISVAASPNPVVKNAVTTFTITFDGTAPSNVSGYDWAFGDNTTDHTSGKSTQHIYAAAGGYTARVTVTTTDGNSGNATTQVTVTN